MTGKEYYSDDWQDRSLDPGFVAHCRDNTIPVSVVGNGGSLNELTDDQIAVINESRLLRCNWAFKDPSKIKKQFAIYFAQAYGGGGEKNFTDKVERSWQDKHFIYYRFAKFVVYNFHPMCSFMDEDKHPVWPTTGIQMLMTSAFLFRPKKIYIAGIDMYTYKRPALHLSKRETAEWFKKYGKTFSESPTTSAGTTFKKENLTYITPQSFIQKLDQYKFTKHFIEVDILVLFFTFLQFIYNDTDVEIFSCSVLSMIYNETKQNYDTVNNYFTKPYEGVSFTSNYKMWSLVNKVVKNLSTG